MGDSGTPGLARLVIQFQDGEIKNVAAASDDEKQRLALMALILEEGSSFHAFLKDACGRLKRADEIFEGLLNESDKAKWGTH